MPAPFFAPRQPMHNFRLLSINMSSAPSHLRAASSAGARNDTFVAYRTLFRKIFGKMLKFLYQQRRFIFTIATLCGTMTKMKHNDGSV